MRGVYESAGLARKLAHEPDAAEKWVQKGTWHPDREVRRWVEQHGGPADVSREFYGHASDAAHTTFLSVAAFFDEIENCDLPICIDRFDERFACQSMLGVVGAGLFIAHCVRNALADEAVLPVDLGQRIVALHEEALGEDVEHLHRDWDDVARRQDELRQRVNSAEGLDDRLAADPHSLHNLLRPGTSGDEPDGLRKRTFGLRRTEDK